MALSLRAQALTLGLGLLLGLLLGLAYDGLRPLRRRWGGPGWDLLFAALCFAGAFLYGQGPCGGRLGLWELGAAMLGLGLYLQGLSPLFLPRYCRILGKMAHWGRKSRTQIKKCSDLLKFFFQKMQSCIII